MEHALRRYRHEQGLSLDALAERVDVSKSTLSRIETWDQDPSLDLIRKIVAVTGGAVTANDFVSQPTSETSA